MRRTRGSSRRPVALAVSSILALASLSSLAQEAPPEDDAQPAAPAVEPAAAVEEPTMEVTITGSRIARPETDFANPIVSIDAEAIQKSGTTNLTEYLSRSPALVGSTTGNLTGGSNTNFGETGLNLLDLRNLGIDRTLVLVDGRRHVAGLAGSAAVDIDAIPTDLIEAVDVLTGGASAIYGADGVSGVVNFRLKHDFEGIATRAQLGQSRYGDGENAFGSITLGKNFAEGRGNIAFAYEYNADQRVSDQRRPFLRDPETGDLFANQGDVDDSPDLPDNIPYRDVRYADSATNGAVDVEFDYVSDFEGDGDVYDRGLVLENNSAYAIGGSSTRTSIYQGDLFPKMRRNLANVLTHFDFSDSVSAFFEGKFVRSRAYSLSQPAFDLKLLLYPDNPFMPDVIRNAIVPGAAAEFMGDPDQRDAVGMNRDDFDLGINTEEATRDTLRGVAGLTGKLSDHLKYEVSYVYGQTWSRLRQFNNRNTAKWIAATDVVLDPATGQPVCRSSLDPQTAIAGCLPYNVFGENVRDPAAADFVNDTTVSHSMVTQHVLSGSISGNLGSFLALPGGSIGYAAGAEYRRESSDFTPDPRIQASETWIEGEQPASGEFAVKEIFGELNLPILEDMRFVKLFSIGAAVRLSDYDTIGQTATWKVDSVYAPVKSLSLRGTYSQAVRAPNIAELFQPPSYLSNFITDPCDVQELNNGSSARAANCAQILEGLGIDPTTFEPSDNPQASIYTDGLASGNENLGEETAKTWTAGIVVRPSSLPAFSMTADWYSIKIKQAISTPEAEDVARLCVDQPTIANVYCPGISRNGNTGFINGFTVRPENVAAFTSSGLDTSFNYLRDTEKAGQFDFRLIGGYLHRLEFISTPGAEVVSDRGQQYMPRYVATFDLTWQRGRWGANYGVEWFDRTARYSNAETNGDPDIAPRRYLYAKEKWEHHVQLEVDVTEKVNVYAGVNNLFDEKPEFGSSVVETYSSYPVSAMGQFFYAGVKASF